MREEGFVAGTEDVRLTIEILVPSTQVGRIIGKGGQNVRELQRVTGSIIKLSEQQSTSPSADEEATVQIIGPFFSVQVSQRFSFTIRKLRIRHVIDEKLFARFLFDSQQSAQRRIRAMVLQSSGAPGAGVTGSRAGRGSSQEAGSRSRRDGSTTSQQGAAATQQQQQHVAQQQSSSTSPSSQQQQSQNQ